MQRRRGIGFSKKDGGAAKMARSKTVILIKKWPNSEENQAILKREVAQIHANAVIRRLSAKNVNAQQFRRLLEAVIEDARQHG